MFFEDYFRYADEGVANQSQRTEETFQDARSEHTGSRRSWLSPSQVSVGIFYARALSSLHISRGPGFYDSTFTEQEFIDVCLRTMDEYLTHLFYYAILLSESCLRFDMYDALKYLLRSCINDYEKKLKF
jgi:hypothetical protein